MSRLALSMASVLLLVTACGGERVTLDPDGVEVVDEAGEPIGYDGPIAVRGVPECGADTVAVIQIDHPLGDLEQGERRTYVRDPDAAVDPRLLEAPYDPRSSLSSDARFTGFQAERYTIWLGADSDQYIYLVDGPRVEAWPRVETLPCAGIGG